MPPITVVGRSFEPVLNLEYRPRFSRLLPRTGGRSAILGMEQLVPREFTGLIQTEARILEPLTVGIFDAPGSVRHPDHLRYSSKQGLISLGTSLECGSLFFDTLQHLKSFDRIHNFLR